MPLPPSMLSLPAPPVMRSLPSPPLILSLPAPPVMTSLPSFPLILSARLVPLTTSASFVPVIFTNLLMALPPPDGGQRKAAGSGRPQTMRYASSVNVVVRAGRCYPGVATGQSTRFYFRLPPNPERDGLFGCIFVVV